MVAATPSSTAIIDFRRTKRDVAGPGVRDRVRPQPERPDRPRSTTRTARSATSWPRWGSPSGQVISSGAGAEIKPGNALPLANIPLGTTIHNLEVQPGRGGQLVRSAGVAAQLLAREGEMATVRMPSGEVRRIDVRCFATVGQVGNADHENQNIGKAGKSRWRGWRPSVRGMAMNPFDHPHGGGEGRSGAGGNPQTPWGKPALGYRTRRNKKTDRMIVRRRKK